MSSTPLISIAMCTYNGAKYLQQQVDSLLSQTIQDFEVIVVDDVSNDGTWELLQEIAHKDSRFRIERNEKNLGPTKNFQHAMEQCHGEYIAPCDQDDIWEPQKLEKLLAVIGDHDMAYHNSAYIDSDGKPMGSSIAHELPMHRGRRPFDYIFFNTVSGHALLMRRDLLEISTPFPEILYYDWWLALCAATRNGVYYLDEALVQFRRHSGAHSNLGLDRSAQQRQQKAKLDREWLNERRLFLSLMASNGSAYSQKAQILLDAIDTAVNSSDYWPLRKAFWVLRNDFPRQKSNSVSNSLSLSQKFVRRIERIRSRNTFSLFDNADDDSLIDVVPLLDSADQGREISLADKNTDKKSTDKAWLDQQIDYLKDIMQSNAAQKKIALEIYNALMLGIEKNQYAPLKKAIWKHRSLMPKEYGSHSVGAFKLSKRMIRRIQRVYGD